MSKNQKQSINLNVETVENWTKTIAYIVSTIAFWHIDDKWPLNLCISGLEELNEDIKKYLPFNA